jgi:hypothetical protein
MGKVKRGEECCGATNADGECFANVFSERLREVKKGEEKGRQEKKCGLMVG